MVEKLSQSLDLTGDQSLVDSQVPKCFQVINKPWLWSGFGVLFLILVDQITKLWANQAGLVSLNQGVAFGMSLPPVLLVMTTTLLLIGVGWGWWQWAKSNRNDHILAKNQLLQLFSYAMILAGGISNLIDRLIWTGVRDWLPIPLTSLHNNLADWLIVVGCLGLVWSVRLTGCHAEPPTSSLSS